jgi:HNH endonuclease
MAKYRTIPIDVLRQVLDYNPDTGELFWKERHVEMFVSDHNSQQHNANMWNIKFAGKKAMTLKLNGYLGGRILGYLFIAHRVIWALNYGEWPNEIDHENHIRSDNRIKNLKSVTHSENLRNARIRSDNTSGVVGVCWSKKHSKWQAQIFVNSKNIFLGCFVEKLTAISVRKAAEIKFGFHSNHGKA